MESVLLISSSDLAIIRVQGVGGGGGHSQLVSCTLAPPATSKDGGRNMPSLPPAVTEKYPGAGVSFNQNYWEKIYKWLVQPQKERF